MSVVQVGGEVTIGCKPSASPKAVINWRKASEVLRQNKRYHHKPVSGLLGVLCLVSFKHHRNTADLVLLLTAH